MANDTTYKEPYEDLQQTFSETLESYSAAKSQLRRQRTTTVKLSPALLYPSSIRLEDGAIRKHPCPCCASPGAYAARHAALVRRARPGGEAGHRRGPAERCAVRVHEPARTSPADPMVGSERLLPAVQAAASSPVSAAEAGCSFGQARMLEYFGGVPAALVPEQLKAAVTRSCWYDPNTRPMKKYGGISRRALFDRIERSTLRPLPATRFEHYVPGVQRDPPRAVPPNITPCTSRGSDTREHLQDRLVERTIVRCQDTPREDPCYTRVCSIFPDSDRTQLLHCSLHT